MFMSDGPNMRQGLEEPFLSSVDLEAPPPLLVKSESTRAEEDAMIESLRLLNQKIAQMKDTSRLSQSAKIEMESNAKAHLPDLDPLAIRFVLKTIGYTSVQGAWEYLNRKDKGLFTHPYHGANGLCILCHQVQRLHCDPEVIMIRTETDTCPICYEYLERGQKIKTLNCSHSFHDECLKETLKFCVQENKLNLLVCPEASCRD